MHNPLIQVAGSSMRKHLLRSGNPELRQAAAQRAPDTTATMVCGYCSTGCGLDVHLAEGEATGLSPAAAYPVNRGAACPKGWEALTVLEAPDRATTPLVRDASGRFVPCDWTVALATFTARFKTILADHGPDSVAFLGSGQLPSEELAFLGSLARFGMGLRHGDGNTRQCMASAVVAYKQAFGFDAPPFTYADLEESDTIVLIGSNVCIAHPILWERVMRNRHRPRIIVIDPRRTETAMAATLHLPLRPKSDLVLLYGLARELIQRGAIDRTFIDAHTRGFDDFASFVEPFTLERISVETGLPAAAIGSCLELIHRGEQVSFWWTMGVNQSHQGVRTAQAIINLALMTGNIGRPGTGANSITGQCNAMGSRLFANTTTLLGGHDFANSDHREKVARVLRIPAARIPAQPGWAYPEILEGILRGTIRGLWVVGTNPAHSWINQDFARDVLARLDFLVVQDMYTTTETARSAHLVFPAAGWGEKSGTFINSERRIGVIKKVARAPGQALADFSIFRLIAEAWGCGELFSRWTDPEAVFQILKTLTAGQPCDMTGIEGYAHLDAAGGIQWPFAKTARDRKPRVAEDAECRRPDSGAVNPALARRSRESKGFDHEPSLDSTERRLFGDGRFYHADGRARFLFEESRPLPEPVNEQFPLLLNTGRGTAAQWHTQTRTGKSPVLRKLAPERLILEISPADARRLGIAPHSKVTIASRRATINATALITPTTPEGQVFLPMHDPTTNRLTDAIFDPYSRQPAYKACAVAVSPGTC
jgi:assimilatory nitrate reductase catalytic subunit